jgi:hypothetical protein
LVTHNSDICSPLTALTGKNVPFEWTPECARVFTTLKNLLRWDVFLAAYDWDKPAYLETDASNVAYAGVIAQDGPDGVRRPIVMFSHKFRDDEKNWPVHDKELYTIRAAQTGVFDWDIRISNRPFDDVCKSLAAESGLKSRNVEKRINAV